MHHQQVIVNNRTPSKLDSPPSLHPKQTITFKTWNIKNPEQSICHKATLKNDQLDPLLEEHILQMKVGEMWEFTIHKKEQRRQICLEVLEAGEIVGEIDLNPYSKAEKLKLEGNQLLKQKKYEQAIRRYEQGYHQLEYDCSPKSVQLNLSIMSNLALATLNSNSPAKCLSWCEKYIEQCFEPNKKIMYRKIGALKNMKSWEEAKKVLAIAKKEWEKDEQTVADFDKLGEQIDKEQKVQRAKERKVYTNMFG